MKPNQIIEQTISYLHDDVISLEYATAIIKHFDGQEQVEKVRQWILKNVKQSFNKREAHQRLRGKFHKLDECFAILERQGFLRKESRATGGRPSTWYHRLDTPSSFDHSDIQQLKALL